jgi:hypothetical protein
MAADPKKICRACTKDTRPHAHYDNDLLCMDPLANRAILHYLSDKEWYGLSPLLPERIKQ